MQHKRRTRTSELMFYILRLVPLTHITLSLLLQPPPFLFLSLEIGLYGRLR